MRPPNELRPKSCPCVGHNTFSAEWSHGFRRMGSCAEWTQFAPNELSSRRFRPPNGLSCRWMSSCVRRMDSVCVERAQFLHETGQFFVRRMSSVWLRLALAADLLHFTPNGLRIFRRMSSFRKRKVKHQSVTLSQTSRASWGRSRDLSAERSLMFPRAYTPKCNLFPDFPAVRGTLMGPSRGALFNVSRSLNT